MSLFLPIFFSQLRNLLQYDKGVRRGIINLKKNGGDGEIKVFNTFYVESEMHQHQLADITNYSLVYSREISARWCCFEMRYNYINCKECPEVGQRTVV